MAGKHTRCSPGGPCMSTGPVSLTLHLTPLVLDTVTVELSGVEVVGVVVTGDWGSSSWHSSSTWLVEAPLRKFWSVRWVTCLMWGSRNWNLAHIHCWRSVISTSKCPLFFLLNFPILVRMLSVPSPPSPSPGPGLPMPYSFLRQTRGMSASCCR